MTRLSSVVCHIGLVRGTLVVSNLRRVFRHVVWCMNLWTSSRHESGVHLAWLRSLIRRDIPRIGSSSRSGERRVRRARSHRLVETSPSMPVVSSNESLAEQVGQMQEALDTFWLLFTGSLVFFMQCGFGMLEAGAVKSKSTQNIMLKNLFDAAIGGLLWWLIGFGITNEGGNAFFGVTPLGNRGSHYATYEQMSADATNNPASGLDWALVFFQFTFAAAAATIVSGAVAERAQLPAYLLFTCICTGVIYPVVAHWVWSSTGWVSIMNPDAFLGGMIDFAGSGVVHMTGGFAAIVGAKVIGPRAGRFDASGHAVMMPGHSSVLQVLGTFILWLGWFGFNAGSTLGINVRTARQAGRIVLTTTLAPCAGGITCVILERVRGKTKRWDVHSMCNGILAGLVSITSSCATVTPWASVLIAVIGGFVYRFASTRILRFRIDDPLDAFAVHGACGLWGVLACALFTTPQYAREVAGLDNGGGLLYGGTLLIGASLVFVLAHVRATILSARRDTKCPLQPQNTSCATHIMPHAPRSPHARSSLGLSPSRPSSSLR